ASPESLMRLGSVPAAVGAVRAARGSGNRGSSTNANATTTVAAANSGVVARRFQARLVIASWSSVIKGQAVGHRGLRRRAVDAREACRFRQAICPWAEGCSPIVQRVDALDV